MKELMFICLIIAGIGIYCATGDSDMVGGLLAGACIGTGVGSLVFFCK